MVNALYMIPYNSTRIIFSQDTGLVPIIFRSSKFVDDEVIFQDDNTLRHSSMNVKTFLQDRHISLITWPANSSALDLIKDSWLKWGEK
uniref:Tc1-like transposase DDE domain-containing protein n=1 Tax=Fundulus heteroclitus TaxID=8078 RepID=A0A3Q2PBP0_FUNHE